MFKSLINIFQRNTKPIQSGKYQPELSAPPVIQNQYYILPINEQLIFDSKNPSQHYKVDLLDLTCTCPDWQQYRAKYPANSFNRCCKHVVKALSIKSNFIYQPWLRKLIEDTGLLGEDFNHQAIYKTTLIKTNAILYIFYPHGSVIIHIHSGQSYNRFCYSIKHGTWMDDEKPNDHQLILKTANII